VNASAALLIVLLLCPALPATELLFERQVDFCPVEPADRWGWRTEVLSEAPGRWRVIILASDPTLPDPAALVPLREAVLAVQARLIYDAARWTEDPGEALLAGRGNCVSFTVVLERDLALMGFRTRRVHGLLFHPDGGGNPHYLAGLGCTPHRWIEVFMPDHGWVPLDPVASGGRLTARHLALRGNDTEGWLSGARIEVLRWD